MDEAVLVGGCANVEQSSIRFRFTSFFLSLFTILLTERSGNFYHVRQGHTSSSTGLGKFSERLQVRFFFLLQQIWGFFQKENNLVFTTVITTKER